MSLGKNNEFLTDIEAYCTVPQVSLIRLRKSTQNIKEAVKVIAAMQLLDVPNIECYVSGIWEWPKMGPDKVPPRPWIESDSKVLVIRPERGGVRVRVQKGDDLYGYTTKERTVKDGRYFYIPPGEYVIRMSWTKDGPKRCQSFINVDAEWDPREVKEQRRKERDRR